MKKNIICALSLAGMMLLAASCSDGDANDSGKHNRPSWTAEEVALMLNTAPQWTPIPDETLASSMTVTVALDGIAEKDFNEDDMIEAYCGNECLGVAHPYTDYGRTRFYLYVLPPKDTKKMISFGYYSAKNKRVYYWTNMLKYENNRSYGTYLEPYTLQISSSDMYVDIVGVVVGLEGIKDLNVHEDRMAIFVNGICRYVVDMQKLKMENGQYRFDAVLPVCSLDDKITIRRYSYAQDKIYTSDEYGIGEDGIIYINNINWH